MQAFRITVLTIVFAIMIGLTGFNLTFSNTIGETCGIIHPYIFQTQVSIVDPTTGRDWSSISHIPTSADEQMDTYLRIYDENGKLLEQNDDYDGSSSGIIDFTVSTQRMIIVEVASFDDASQGFYALEVIDTPEDLSEVYQNIEVGTDIRGEIKPHNRNSYLLSLEADQAVSIFVNGTDINGAELDTYLRIYNESNQLINQNDDFDGVGSGISPFVVSEASTFIIEVATFDDIWEGTYNLAVELYDDSTPTPDLAVVDNPQTISSDLDVEIKEGANLQVDESLSDDIAVNTRMQHNLALQANQLVDIYLQSNMDTYLRIYDETGLLIAENDDASDSNAAVFGFSLPQDSTVLVVVGSYDDVEEGAYELFVESSDLQVNQGESLTLNEPLQSELEEGTRTRHEINIVDGQSLSIALEADFDTYLRIYDVSGRMIAENDDFGFNTTNSGFSNFSLDGEGLVIIEVASYDDTEAGQYELRVQESNLQTIDGGMIQLDTPVDGELDVDTRIRYRLDLIEGQAITINLTGEEASGMPLQGYLRLYDTTGELLYLESDIPEDVGAVIPRYDSFENSSVIIEVAGYQDAEAGSYQLLVTEAVVTLLEGESLTVGSRIENSLEQGQRVQHALALNANQPVVLMLSGTMDTYLRVYDEAGNLLAENDDLVATDAGIVGFSVDNASTVIVETGSYADSVGGSYTMLVEPYSLDFVQEFFDLTIIDAADIELEEVVRGSINEGERLHHRISLRAGQLVNIFLVGQHVDDYLMDTYLRVYDEAGTLLAESDDFDGVSSGIMDFSVEHAAIVIIEVGTYDDSEAGIYQLLVEANNRQITTLESLEVGSTVTGSIKTNQRIQYPLTLEAERSISIFLRPDESQQGLGLGELASYFRGSANEWVSCLEYYGYVVESAYVINQDGLGQFIYGSKLDGLCDLESSDCDWSAQITLTAFGQFLFYVILPGLAIVLPIINVFMLKGDWEVLWFVSLILVALYVLTSALLYVHLGTVSGIVALQEFAYGMFGGTATGAAIAFMTKVLDNFSIDRREDTSEQAKAVLAIIESQLRHAIEEHGIDINPVEAQTPEDEPKSEE